MNVVSHLISSHRTQQGGRLWTCTQRYHACDNVAKEKGLEEDPSEADGDAMEAKSEFLMCYREPCVQKPRHPKTKTLCTEPRTSNTITIQRRSPANENES